MVIRLDKRSGSLIVPLGEHNISGKLGEVLAQFDPLQSGDQLELSRFGFTGEDMIALFEWLKVMPCRRISLEMNGIGSPSCAVFRDLFSRADCSLKYATFARNPIGVGAIDIFEGLSRNDKMVSIDLSYCDITEEIITKCMPSIIANDCLIVINLIGNDITGKTICQILSKTAQNKTRHDAIRAEITRETNSMLREETAARQRQMAIVTLELRQTLIGMRQIQRMNKLEQSWATCHFQDERNELEAINKLMQQGSDGKGKKKKKGKKAKK